MKKILTIISNEIKEAFVKAGYSEELGRVTRSNRPDLCEFQCNGAMAGAKIYKKAPLMIAKEIEALLDQSEIFSKVEAVTPGFLNLNIKEEFLTNYIAEMDNSPKYGLEEAKEPRTIVVDYGGPNVAKPLHVGHLRSAIIGESVKRIARYMGHHVIGDIHMGDWGLQMGLIITEIKFRQPELPYFDVDYTGEYPKAPPFTITELEEIYPEASRKSKEDQGYKEKAMEATFQLQNGEKGYRAIWKHIMAVSVTDLKKNYDKLNVSFDLWKGEADVHHIIPEMVDYLKKGDYAYFSDGALVVDVKEETDTKEVPPCMILKSDGAALYNTTDLATIMERMNEIKPDEIIYVVDKRQGLYFEQVFRCAKKTKLVLEDTQLKFLGFGTMNGKDGKPFKTRDGGVMRLEKLIEDINQEMYRKIIDNRKEIPEIEAKEIAATVALSAMKYGDLSNQASKDYVFDMERFTSFEGDTGPYLLYTTVRIKSIIAKYIEHGGSLEEPRLQKPDSQVEKELMLVVSQFNEVIESAYEELAPHKICSYLYDLANAFNKFYHATPIIPETDQDKKQGWIALLIMIRNILGSTMDILGFAAPDKM